MFGQRLRLARKRKGLSMQALAGGMAPSVSVQAISKYEAGRMMPSSAVLVGLGKALGVSPGFLLGGQVVALEGVEWRKHSASRARERAMAEALVVERLEDYLAIEDILELPSAPDPFAGLRAGGRGAAAAAVTDEEAIDAMALAVREEWKLGIDPIPSMTALLEDKGLKVVEADLPERINGLACRVRRAEGRPPVEVVVVSRGTGVERKRFNLAHELAHGIVVPSSAPARARPRAPGAGAPALKPERAMDRFAGAFLVPREHLQQEAGRTRHGITWHELVRLKRTYGVSAAAMLMRLGQAGILPSGAVEYAFRTFARGWRREEPAPLGVDEGFAAFEKPRRFERLVWRALGERLISPVRAAQMLGRPLADVEREIRGPGDP